MNYLSEHKVLQGTLCIILFIISVTLVVVGQKNIGLPGVGMMLLGVAGLLILLGYYNSFYNK